MTKRLMSILMIVLFMSCFQLSICYATGFGDTFGGLFGGSSTEEDDDLPSFEDAFTGSMITVNLDGKKLKIHENFKIALDKYEAFFDEYIEFMKNPNMLEYVTFLGKYNDAMQSLDTIDSNDMNDDETIYYTAVMLRIEGKLLAVAEQ